MSEEQDTSAGKALPRRKLGRGLDALLGDTRREEVLIHRDGRPDNSPESPGDSRMRIAEIPREGLAHIPVAAISPLPGQPRQYFDEAAIDELAASIAARGLIQPVVVRRREGGFQLVAGERRWRATQLAGIDKIPAVIRDVPDEAAIAMALIENIQREDLNPIEEAMALKRLQDEFELTHQEVAQAVGKSRTTVTNLLRLIALTDDVKKLLEHGDLETTSFEDGCERGGGDAFA